MASFVRSTSSRSWFPITRLRSFAITSTRSSDFPAIKKMLLLYKQGKSTPDVFKEALGFTLDQFDTRILHMGR